MTNIQQHPRLREYKRWLNVFLYTIFLLAGQSTATLLGRLYFNKGGNSKWIATFVQSAGFPLLLPLLLYLPSQAKLENMANNDSSKTKPKLPIIFSLYLAFGLLMTGNDLMYSYGLVYLPLSTYSIICATQLAFNALFSFFLNSQKLTFFILNSIVLLTISVSLLAIYDDSEDTKGIPKGKLIIGFFFTLAASATFSLHLSLVQLCFKKIIKRETFSAVLDMQLYPSLIATCACIVGLFVSGEWKFLDKEMKEYEKGRMSYVMTLLWIAVTWQISSIGMLGLIFEVSSLFSIVIGTLELPITPILAVMVFHDKIKGVKVIALLLAVWGFLSYMYQHYLDDQKVKQKSYDIEVSKGELEI
ncbi:probable purine permease 11 [Abrus precatorius]|uniref:Probable purine permease n=1 Tax=Abrus precatorius TaxID=3816 RepID=A0A8B8K162_ABRPR|nr:probable purine permease 11 [Abrus precatorius]